MCVYVYIYLYIYIYIYIYIYMYIYILCLHICIYKLVPRPPLLKPDRRPWLQQQQPSHVWRVTTTTTNSYVACYHDNNRLMSGVLQQQQPTHLWRVATTGGVDRWGTGGGTRVPPPTFQGGEDSIGIVPPPLFSSEKFRGI